MCRIMVTCQKICKKQAIICKYGKNIREIGHIHDEVEYVVLTFSAFLIVHRVAGIILNVCKPLIVGFPSQV